MKDFLWEAGLEITKAREEKPGSLMSPLRPIPAPVPAPANPLTSLGDKRIAQHDAAQKAALAVTVHALAVAKLKTFFHTAAGITMRKGGQMNHHVWYQPKRAYCAICA